MYRHRVNLIIKDSDLNEVLHVFLKQRMPLSKRSVFECFLSQLLEDLWKEMKDDFALFVLCKAYEQVVNFSLKTKAMEDVIKSISRERAQIKGTEKMENTKVDQIIQGDSNTETQLGEGKDISIDDLLL